jgi:hypothetical protein
VDYDESEFDNAVLTLLDVCEFESGWVWKRIDFAVIRFYAKRGERVIS